LQAEILDDELDVAGGDSLGHGERSSRHYSRHPAMDVVGSELVEQLRLRLASSR
jgi:hypothetical protein